MITKFDTSSTAPTTTGGGNSTLVYIIAGAVVIYLGYRFIIKPQMEKNKKPENQ